MKCGCYHEKQMLVWNPIKYRDGQGYETIGFCYGTKECERCYCKGNRLECDFYPEVREKAKKETTEYKIEEAIKLLKDNGYVVYKEC